MVGTPEIYALPRDLRIAEIKSVQYIELVLRLSNTSGKRGRIFLNVGHRGPSVLWDISWGFPIGCDRIQRAVTTLANRGADPGAWRYCHFVELLRLPAHLILYS